MKSSAQIEHECEQVRAQFAATVDELRARATPGQVVDEVIDYVGDTKGAAFFQNLQRQVVDNPLPVALVGIGIGWLIFQRARPVDLRETTPLADYDSSVAGRESAGAVEAVRNMGSRLSSAARKVRGAASRASDALSSARETAASSIDAVRDRTASAYEAASDAIRRAKDSSSNLGRNVLEGSQSVLDFCREQPLVLAGVGLAIGAAVGAALPRSETEDRWMGQASDETNDAARRIGAKTTASAKQAYREVADPVQGEPQSSPSISNAPSSRSSAANEPMAQSAKATPPSEDAGQHEHEQGGAACPPNVPSAGRR